MQSFNKKKNHWSVQINVKRPARLKAERLGDSLRSVGIPFHNLGKATNRELK